MRDLACLAILVAAAFLYLFLFWGWLALLGRAVWRIIG